MVRLSPIPDIRQPASGREVASSSGNTARAASAQAMLPGTSWFNW
ncbi:hypothetical protein ACFQZC_16165 [Streptacidiphilus monticola]